MIVFAIGYLLLFIWQVFDARKLAKKFNALVKQLARSLGNIEKAFFEWFNIYFGKLNHVTKDRKVKR